MFPVECNGINQQDQKAQILPSRSAHEDRMDFHHCDADLDDTEEHICLIANTTGFLLRANLFTNALNAMHL